MAQLRKTDPFEAILIEMAEIKKSKTGDYNGGSQALFKTAFDEIAREEGRDAIDVAHTFVVTKTKRISSIMAQIAKDPEFLPDNESLVDTLTDLANYAVWMRMLVQRGQDPKVAALKELGIEL